MYSRMFMRVFAVVLFVSLLVPVHAAERPYVAIEQRLSVEQMQATGLDRLSPEQLALLNRLLGAEHAAVASETRAAERDRRKKEAAEPVASTLVGEFRGWKTGTVFELANDQRWRVVDGEFHAGKPLSRPNVTVRPGVFGSWYLTVEGVGVQAKVKRVERD